MKDGTGSRTLSSGLVICMDSSMEEHNQPLHLQTIQVGGDVSLLQIEEKEEAEHKKEKDQG